MDRNEMRAPAATDGKVKLRYQQPIPRRVMTNIHLYNLTNPRNLSTKPNSSPKERPTMPQLGVGGSASTLLQAGLVLTRCDEASLGSSPGRWLCFFGFLGTFLERYRTIWQHAVLLFFHC